MKAAIYRGIKDVEIIEKDNPTCDDKGIVIKNKYAAICGSDITAYNHGGEANMIFPNNEFGHEMIAEVVKVGKDVEGIKVGDRVFPVPGFAKDDTHKAAMLGGFSEYVDLPNCKLNKSCYIVPDEIDDLSASIIEPFTVGCNAVQRIGNIEKGKNAIVFGAGPIGLSSAMTFKYLGCKVAVVDLIDKRLDIAKELGMEVVNLSKEDYFEKAAEIFGTMPGVFSDKTLNVDYYVDAAGNQAVIDSFMNYAKFFATISVVAVHHKPITLDMVKLTYPGLRIIGPCGGMGEDVKLVMEILKNHAFDVKKMITHIYPHSEIKEAFEMASNSKEALKVVIKY